MFQITVSLCVFGIFTLLVPALTIPQDAPAPGDFFTNPERTLPLNGMLPNEKVDLKRSMGPGLEADCVCTALDQCDLQIPAEDDIDFREVSKQHLMQCGEFQMCCPKNSRISAPPAPPPPTEEGSCGVRNTAGLVNRIVNDNLNNDDTKMGEFPWQVAIMKKISGGQLFVGGGALIHPSFVITAPHIFKGAKAQDLIARVGEYHLLSDREPLPHENIQVREIVAHEKVSFNTGHNDIALLFLERPATLAPNVLPICLPNQGEQFADGLRCTVTGWGKDKFDQPGEYQAVMKMVELPVVRSDRCENLLKRTRLGSKFTLHRGFLCAGGEEGMDACKGDGGGPLSCMQDGFYKLAGIVVWGVGCGQKDVPAVYMNVARYTDWIDFHISNRIQQ